MAHRVFGIRLTPRQAWAWRRLGNDAIRQWLAPDEICVQCGIHPSQSNTRNAWFCYPCHDALSQQHLLPDSSVETLILRNQQLEIELRKLRNTIEQKVEPPATPKQLDLFHLDEE